MHIHPYSYYPGDFQYIKSYSPTVKKQKLFYSIEMPDKDSLIATDNLGLQSDLRPIGRVRKIVCRTQPERYKQENFKSREG